MKRVPTNIITGWLGVGKTTAIRHLLSQVPKGESWAVIVNEFGEVGIDGAAFSGKKSLVRKMLAYGLEINQRYGSNKITPTDVGEEGSEGLVYLRSMGGRSAWELGPE